MTPPESPLFPRFGASESSSSKKMTHGLALLARLNTATQTPEFMTLWTSIHDIVGQQSWHCGPALMTLWTNIHDNVDQHSWHCGPATKIKIWLDIDYIRETADSVLKTSLRLLTQYWRHHWDSWLNTDDITETADSILKTSLRQLTQ